MLDWQIDKLTNWQSKLEEIRQSNLGYTRDHVIKYLVYGYTLVYMYMLIAEGGSKINVGMFSAQR